MPREISAVMQDAQNLDQAWFLTVDDEMATFAKPSPRLFTLVTISYF
jgi:hypothetical protein